MHHGHPRALRVRHVQVEALRLADVRAAADRQLDERLLWNLPDRLVDLFDPVRNFLDTLYRAIVRDKLVLDVWSPKVKCDKIPHQVPIHADELAGKHPSCEDVGRERLEALVVTEHL